MLPQQSQALGSLRAGWDEVTRKWAAVVEANIPYLREYFHHPGIVPIMLRSLCNTDARLLPNYRTWSCGPGFIFEDYVQGIILEPGFLESRVHEVAILLVENSPNQQWLASTYVGIAVYEALHRLAQLSVGQRPEVTEVDEPEDQE